MPSVKIVRPQTKAILNQAIESLEPRQMLSSTKSVSLYPFESNNFSGYSPTQIRTAYGFTSVADTGAGQTIAIVAAGDYDPTEMSSDLSTFDSHFGLSNPTVQTFYADTGMTGLDYNANFNGDGDTDGEITEECLDVEWAHAIAPGANIDIVQAASDDEVDICAAAATAASLPNVSVVSISYGYSEDPYEVDLDPYFATTKGVTFVAASGDEGISAALYPASSPYVLSVGGTSLTMSNGAYSSETTWVGSTGGESVYEPAPTYQTNVMNVAHRTVPDVSYDADPNTGVTIYCSNDGGYEDVGGTSMGAPQWAGLLAIVNQERVANGLTTLNGATQTLPALYSFYGARRHTAAYYEYHDLFNDITTGQNYSEWALEGGEYYYGDDVSGQVYYDGGFTGVSATAGYDQVTGLGTPKANTLIPALAAYEPPVAAAKPAVTEVAMSRAERRRIEAALAALPAHVNVVVNNDYLVHPTVVQAPAPAPLARPSVTPSNVGLPNSLAIGADHAMQQGGATDGAVMAALSSNILVAAADSKGSTTFTNGHSISDTGYLAGTFSLSSPMSMSLAAMPGVATANLETYVEAAAATTYSSSLQLVRIDSVNVLADMASLFIRQIGSALVPHGEQLTGSNVPMAVIVGVLTVDALLLGRAMRRRRWDLQRCADGSFALLPLSNEE